MREHLQLKNYSPNTQKTYLNLFSEFLKYQGKETYEIEEEDIRRYQLHLINDKRLSVSSQNQSINAIKYFYEKVEKQERKTYYIERPAKPFLLPRTLSVNEVSRIFKCTCNLKHEVMLKIIYSGGLRRSEALNLKKQHLLFDQQRILICGGKGRKDRLTLLSACAAFHLYKRGHVAICGSAIK